MSWIEFHSGNRDDPRLLVLCRSLRLSIPYALGHLALLWSWAASEKLRAFTGNLAEFTPDSLAEASKFPIKEPQDSVKWAKALIDAGYLSRDNGAPEVQVGESLGGHTAIVGWVDFCGEPTKKRMERQTADNGSHAADDWLTSLLNGGSLVSSKAVNPLWSLFLVMKYVKKGKDKTAVKEDRRWDELNKGRQLPWIKKILEDGYSGDIKMAAKAIFEIGSWYERTGFPWDASTVHKRLTDYEEGRLNGR